MEEELGTIKEGEYHPAAESAMQYIHSIMATPRWLLLCESFASVALSGDRLSEICYSTMDRLNKGQPVSDRYVLGLAWTLKGME